MATSVAIAEVATAVAMRSVEHYSVLTNVYPRSWWVYTYFHALKRNTFKNTLQGLINW